MWNGCASWVVNNLRDAPARATGVCPSKMLNLLNCRVEARPLSLVVKVRSRQLSTTDPSCWGARWQATEAGEPPEVPEYYESWSGSE